MNQLAMPTIYPKVSVFGNLPDIESNIIPKMELARVPN
jgi:hypothetical protein